MSLDEVVRYPEGITPHGAYHLLRGDLPIVSFHAHDDSIDFRVLGGLAAPFHDRRKAAPVVKGLRGLIAPWQYATQKGATQHGVDTVSSLFDQGEITGDVEFTGPNAKAVRRLVRDWIAANEHMKTAEVAVLTQEMGRWSTDVRWGQTPPDKILGAHRKRQPFTQSWFYDSAFWRGDDVFDSFRIIYDAAAEDFNYTTTGGLSGNWDAADYGDGGGDVLVDGQLVFDRDPEDPVGSGGRDFIFRFDDFDTDTNNQVVEMTFGAGSSLYAIVNAVAASLATDFDLWARMPVGGTLGEDGVRLRIGFLTMRLSYFVGGVETVLREWPSGTAPTPGDKFTLVAGYEGNERLFRVYRNGAELQSVLESGTGSPVGAGNRCAGVALHINPVVNTLLINRVPLGVVRWSAGDNTDSANQSGFVKFTNLGDQDMPLRYTCFGPGTFFFHNGPGSPEYVRFGPLLPNQVMMVNTDGEKRPVTDMTSVPAAPQALNQYQQALKDFINFATAGNVPPLLQQIESMFGILPPQGHPYTLLAGSITNHIPAMSPGKPPQEHAVAVRIEGGNASSMILATGTPLRRWPL